MNYSNTKLGSDHLILFCNINNNDTISLLLCFFHLVMFSQQNKVKPK